MLPINENNLIRLRRRDLIRNAHNRKLTDLQRIQTLRAANRMMRKRIHALEQRLSELEN